MRSPDKFARARIAQAKEEIRRSFELFAAGNPLGAEPEPRRRRDRLLRKANLTPAQARILDRSIQREAEEIGRERAPERGRATESARAGMEGTAAAGGPQFVRGDTIDFVGVAFLARGARVARSVGRVAWKRNGIAQGSGVLIGLGLFMTNNHVVDTKNMANGLIVEFDYERDENNVMRRVTQFAIDNTIFVSDPGLDFSIFALGNRLHGDSQLEDFGSSPLSDADDKHMLGEFANIIQHPQGRLKEVVVRENRLVGRPDDFLCYTADTEEGSSGSPVYNSEWMMIALHHWAVSDQSLAHPQVPHSDRVNVGVRISSIVRHLRKNMGSYTPEARTRLEKALALAGPEAFAGSVPTSTPSSGGHESRTASVRIDPDGAATWTVPIEISVRLPLSREAPEPLREVVPPAPTDGEPDPSDEYADRRGYLPHFLPGFIIPMPLLGPAIIDDAARLIDPVPGENPLELKYHHFSVIMNRRRRLAFVAAAMIDGSSSASTSRTSRGRSDLSPEDRGLADTVASLDAADADSWTADPRIDREVQSGDELYRNQTVPDPQAAAGRPERMYRKGHLLRPSDPAWGSKTRALSAQLDAFHWTNAVPVVFGWGSLGDDEFAPGKGGLWRAVERHVLRNTVAANQRVVSFVGPIFTDDDRKFRFTCVPGRFFKIVVWAEQSVLCALAMILEQTDVIKVWPETAGTDQLKASEAFQEEGEMERVAESLSTVEQIEQLTDLDFGDAVRLADIRHGLPQKKVEQLDDLPLSEDQRQSGAGLSIREAIVGSGPEVDDLKQIKGVGPKLERALNANGIYLYSQIASWSPEEARQVGVLIGYPGRVERDYWVDQAKKLAVGKRSGQSDA